MKHARHAAHAPQEILDDLRTLVAEAEKMAGEAFDEHTDEAASALRARYDAVQARLAEIFDGAKQTVVTKARLADDTIRGNPYSSLAVAAFAGVVVGMLLTRRGSRLSSSCD